MRVLTCTLAALVAVACGAASLQAAPIIFDDFNVDEGHFNLQPSFSGTSAQLSPASTADRDTSVALEGEGSQKLTFIRMAATPTPSPASFRVRHLSGGGTPANNVSFTTSAGVDGFIGFYLKVDTLVGDLQVQMALDGASPNGTTPKSVIADGQWHLYEWDLDNPADIFPIQGIGGSSPLENQSHTIDSIYFINGGVTGPDGEVKMVGYLDFVAKSDSGSIAALVPASTIPEPSSIALAGLGILGLAVAARRRAA